MQEGGDADKICGRVQGEYAQERDNSDEMGDWIKRGRTDMFQDISMKGWGAVGGWGGIQEFCTQSGLNGAS